MKDQKQFTIVIIAALFCSDTFAVWGIEPADFFGGVDATIAVCSKIDPQSVQAGLTSLEKTITPEEKAAWLNVRKTLSYKKSYANEVERLNSLPHEQRKTVCQHAW